MAAIANNIAAPRRDPPQQRAAHALDQPGGGRQDGCAQDDVNYTLSYILHALKRYQGALMEAGGCYELSACIVSYMR